MKILGIDPATVTGWGVIEDGDLKEFGSISANVKMDLPQKLNFVSNQIQLVLDRVKPDYIAIEDTILAISGISVIKHLSRIGAIYIFESYKRVQERVELYEPSLWKANSLPEIKGSAPKWKIQLEVARFFKKLDSDKLTQLENFVNAEHAIVEKKKEELAQLKIVSMNFKRDIDRKRNPLSEDEKAKAKKELAENEKKVAQCKKEFNDMEKKCEQNLSKICTDIYSLTGISSDIADGICIAYCRYKKLI